MASGLAEWEAAVDQLGFAIGVATAEGFAAVTDVLRVSVHPAHERTGRLAASIEMEGPAEGFGGYYATYGPTLAYTRIVELGHKRGPGRPSYRAPHPWFRTGFEREAIGAARDVFVPRWLAVLR